MNKPITPENNLGIVQRTERGFEIIRFKDHYDHPCVLQMSSLADYRQPGISAVWLGCERTNPKILASLAAAHGVETKETTGWVEYPISDDVLFTTQMHLDREQVVGLINHLLHWINDGTFSVGSTDEIPK